MSISIMKGVIRDTPRKISSFRQISTSSIEEQSLSTTRISMTGIPIDLIWDKVFSSFPYLEAKLQL
jgi:hypothetical protein